MKAQLARIVEVVSGHSVRARVHAISESGLELKLEIPLEEAKGLVAGQILWIAWSAHTLPEPLHASQEIAAEVVPRDASAVSVDAALGEVLADKRPQGVPTSTPPTSASRGLAELLGLRFDSR